MIHPLQTLSEAEWQCRRELHRQRVLRWIGPHRERAARQEKHPVFDFLFSYYHFRPNQLETWHPGYGVALAGESARDYLLQPGYVETPGGVTATPAAALKPARHDGIRWIHALLQRVAGRPPAFGCFGLHEWAMVYRTPEVRHAVPLRFDDETLAAIVESQTVRCTHYDAFRFFTPAARPLNRHQPEKTTIHEIEQRGCLHANMDLYKWAFKLTPLIPSELIADCFALACEIRTVDMQASPYDLSAFGYAPIRIETPQGRSEYENRQRRFSEEGIPLRERLIVAYRNVIDAL